MSPKRLPLVTAAGLVTGIVVKLAGREELAAIAWASTTAVALVPLIYAVIRGMLAGKAGVDFIALLAMSGALILHEYLAGAVIALMLTGGHGLEAFASSRAQRELSALLSGHPGSSTDVRSMESFLSG